MCESESPIEDGRARIRSEAATRRDGRTGERANGRREEVRDEIRECCGMITRDDIGGERRVTHGHDDCRRLAALTLAMSESAGLTRSCCVRLSYVDFCMALEWPMKRANASSSASLAMPCERTWVTIMSRMR